MAMGTIHPEAGGETPPVSKAIGLTGPGDAPVAKRTWERDPPPSSVRWPTLWLLTQRTTSPHERCVPGESSLPSPGTWECGKGGHPGTSGLMGPCPSPGNTSGARQSLLKHGPSAFQLLCTLAPWGSRWSVLNSVPEIHVQWS